MNPNKTRVRSQCAGSNVVCPPRGTSFSCLFILKCSHSICLSFVCFIVSQLSHIQSQPLLYAGCSLQRRLVWFDHSLCPVRVLTAHVHRVSVHSMCSQSICSQRLLLVWCVHLVSDHSVLLNSCEFLYVHSVCSRSCLLLEPTRTRVWRVGRPAWRRCRWWAP